MSEPTNIICEYQFLCSKQWSDLTDIKNSKDVRFCADCMKNVYLCFNFSDLQFHAAQSHCVAVQQSPKRRLLGLVAPPELAEQR